MKGGENMAVSTEVVNKIINFYPTSEDGSPVRATQTIDLGEVGGRRLTHGLSPFIRRRVDLPGEPFTPEVTVQPALSLEGSATPLVYRSDVEALEEHEEGLARKIAEHLNVIEARKSL